MFQPDGTVQSLESRTYRGSGQELDSQFIFCRIVAGASSSVSDEIASILEAVAFVVVVNPCDRANEIFDYVLQEQSSLPYVFELYCAGRLVYVQNENTFAAVMRRTAEGLEEVREQVRTVASDIDILTNKVDDLEGKLNDVCEAVAGLQKSVSALNERFGALEGKLNDVCEAVAGLQKSVSALNERFGALEGKLDAIMEIMKM
jgi:uncharacterized protein YoxC